MTVLRLMVVRRMLQDYGGCVDHVAFMQGPVVEIDAIAYRFAAHKERRARKIVHLPGDGALECAVGIHRIYVMKVVTVGYRVFQAQTVGHIHRNQTAVGKNFKQIEMQVMEVFPHVRRNFVFRFTPYIPVTVLKIKFNRQFLHCIAAHAHLIKKVVLPKFDIRFYRKLFRLDTTSEKNPDKDYRQNSYF